MFIGDDVNVFLWLAVLIGSTVAEGVWLLLVWTIIALLSSWHNQGTRTSSGRCRMYRFRFKFILSNRDVLGRAAAPIIVILNITNDILL